MERSNKYYKYLDLIRIFSCIAVFLYHLNILKGGYLLVCTFFVLSGYLSCISAFKNEKFSFKSYYIKKLKHLYLPLLLVVFTTIALISFFPDINYLNLKPETTSVLLGYNNFWQLNANLDYFARHVNSPFMHFWYIAILLQYDLIFPFAFLLLKKLRKIFNKVIPIVLICFLAFCSFTFFYKTSLNSNIMFSYYNTFARAFSWLIGIALGLVHTYYSFYFPKIMKNKSFDRIMFLTYLYILFCLSVFIDAKSVYFPLGMLITTLISVRLIDYSIILFSKEESALNKFIKYLSSISFEIYLVQYPVIFLFQYIKIKSVFIIPLTIILTLLISCIFHFCINFNKNRKMKLLRYMVLFVVFLISIYGMYCFYIAKDHTEEMKSLEKQLNENEKLMQKRQESYLLNLKQEEKEWNLLLENFDKEESNLKNLVNNLSVVGVGDSVMLGAIDNLYSQFPNGYFDAKVSRTAWVANDILIDIKQKNMLGDIIILNLGTNGDCDDSCKIKILKTCGDRKIFWINTTNLLGVNSNLKKLSSKYNNLNIIDWYSVSKNHPEYFVADKIHLTSAGKKAYTKAIYESIYKIYLDEYNKQKEEFIKEWDEKLKEKISFFGNDLLLNNFEYIEEEFGDSKFNIDKNYNFEKLKNNIKNDIENKTLNYKVVFAFDNTFKITLKEYQELIKLCSNNKIYIVWINNQNTNINYQNVEVINFDYNNYLLADKIHITDEGNEILKEKLMIIKNN